MEWATIVYQEYLRTGNLPSHNRVNELAGSIPFTEAFHSRCLREETVQDFLEERGVPIRKIIKNAGSGALSLAQLMCINTLLDFNDTRSDKKKLESLNIPSWQYQAWKKDPAFQTYLRDRAESLFGDNLDEVNRALLDSARSGDIGAVKLIYELTGRYNPRADGQLDPKALITQVLEIIMRRVKDPEVIKEIAADFQLIATSNRFAQPQVIEAVASREISA